VSSNLVTMVRPAACERAHTWISLRLDGELSELERALLDAHLAHCGDCRAAAAGVEGLTRAMRAAPLASPPPRPVLPRLRSRGSLRAFYAAAASTLVLVAGLTGAGFVGAVHIVALGAAPPKLLHVSAVASGMPDDGQLLAHVRVLRLERPVPGRIVWPS
jgi:predicted anti-sigma-YlaC factor YlaD